MQPSINEFAAACAGARQAIEAGDLEAADRLLVSVLTSNPNHAEALFLRSLIYLRVGQYDSAALVLRRSIQLAPGNASSHLNLGIAVAELGRHEEAIEAWNQTLYLDPTRGEAYYRMGSLLARLGRLAEAIKVLSRGVEVVPDFAGIWCNLGTAYAAQGQLDVALEALRRAVELNPSEVAAWYSLGTVRQHLGDAEGSLAALERVVELMPDSPEALSRVLFVLPFQPGLSPQQILDRSKVWQERFGSSASAPAATGEHRKLRVGYIAESFNSNVISYTTLTLARHHDRSRFDVFLYDNRASADPVTEAFKQLGHTWVDASALSHEQLEQRIRDDRIDILVDLMMHIDGNRLPVLARRPAPVQVCYAAYPGTTGLSSIDYRLSDPYLDPPDEPSYSSETTVRLPNSFWCYIPVDGDGPDSTPPPCTQRGHITFGCMNFPVKVNDRVLELWAPTLLAVPTSRLLLLVNANSRRDHIRRHLERLGVSPDRVDFVPRAPRSEYLAYYNRFDISLDTFPYGGHMTGLDSLWMGVPVVTLAGSTHASRGGLSHLSNVGLPDLVARTPEQFTAIATGLARDTSRLAELRASLRGRVRASPLGQGEQFTRDVEFAYSQMWLSACRAHAT